MDGDVEIVVGEDQAADFLDFLGLSFEMTAHGTWFMPDETSQEIE